MKKFIWVAAALSIFALSSRAQAQQGPSADVSAGYSYFRVGGSNGTNLNGFNASPAYNVNSWLGLAGDFGWYHGSPSGVGLTDLSYTFGPRFSYRGMNRIVPFAQALFGGSHLSASSGGVSVASNAFAYDLGGGADVALSSNGTVALRPQVDYVGLRSNGSTTNCVRLSVGVVFHFGKK